MSTLFLHWNESKFINSCTVYDVLWSSNSEVCVTVTETRVVYKPASCCSSPAGTPSSWLSSTVEPASSLVSWCFLFWASWLPSREWTSHRSQSQVRNTNTSCSSPTVRRVYVATLLQIFWLFSSSGSALSYLPLDLRGWWDKSSLYPGRGQRSEATWPSWDVCLEAAAEKHASHHLLVFFNRRSNTLTNDSRLIINN